MADHDIFVSARRPDEVRAAIETEPGASFSASEDPGSFHALVTGAIKVFFHDSHALKARGWPVMLSFNLQGHLAVHP